MANITLGMFCDLEAVYWPTDLGETKQSQSRPKFKYNLLTPAPKSHRSSTVVVVVVVVVVVLVKYFTRRLQVTWCELSVVDLPIDCRH